MRAKDRGWCIRRWFFASVIAMAAWTAAAQVSTTTVEGTVYLANGVPGSGTLQISWPAFTTANNQAVAAGMLNVTVGANGFVNVNLTPNLGAMPAGLFYTAVYHMSDGTTSTEYWVVPASSPATIGQVRTQVMPAAQAVQAVNKAYVDEAVASLAQGTLTPVGGTLTGPLYLSGDPTQALQAADKHYVDAGVASALPLAGGAATGALTGVEIGAAYQVDQFPGVDFGAKLQACLAGLSAVYGGTCDARNFTGTQAMGTNVLVSVANATVWLPCATIATGSQLIATAGTRNVSLHGCGQRGASTASGSQGGTVFAYSGAGAMVQVGDPMYAADTPGFHLDNVVINTTGATAATAQGVVAYRTQELDLKGLYLLGNTNQTGMTLDGTGNYTGGSFYDLQISGFGTAVNAIGHQAANPATTDWMNASAFVRLHIDCPLTNGNPIGGTYGINLQQGDGNTFTGGDVEGCGTALHLGANAENNTFVGLRNENSLTQVAADSGSAYNSWFTGGTMFTGKLTDNGTRNSFLDTFHRSFSGMNGDWYGSQQDATVTNHFRLGTGNGNERGLLNRYQTDYGYRWTMGLSDGTAGEQFYQVLDELNNVYRISIGQYNNGQASTNNQTVINAAGTGAVALNGSNGAGTGGVVFGSGGPVETTVATINNAGNAQFNGTLQVGGISTFVGSTTVRNSADAEIDAFLWAGATANQKESFIYKDYTGASQWYLVKDASNNWAVNSAQGGLDSFKAYQSTNSGDTYIDTSNASGVVRVNYETGAGTQFKVYGGSSGSLYAAFTGTTSIQFPGLGASSGHACMQIDTSGYLTNTGAACGTGTGGAGTVNSGTAGQIAYYSANGTAVSGLSTVPVSVGGTGATTAVAALTALGGASLTASGAQVFAGPVTATKLGAEFQADQFAGADASVKINACITAAIAGGGGTCDARALGGTQVMSQTINVGTSAGPNNGVVLLLPVAGVWEWGMTNGASCGIEQFSGTSIVGLATAGWGGNALLLEPASTATNMDSLYCTDPNPSGGGGYYRASGFFAQNMGSVHGVFTHGLIHVRAFYDESTWSYVQGQNQYGDGWHIDSGCCGASFDHIAASSSAANGVPSASYGGVPLTIGTGMWIPSAATTLNSNAVTTTQTNLTSGLVGMYVAGVGVPSGTTVTAVTSGSTLTMSANATVTASGVAMTVNAGNGYGPGPSGISISDASINSPEIGLPHVQVFGGYSTANVTLKNLYMENPGTDATTPFVYIASDVAGIWFSGVWANANGNPATKYAIESHTVRPWGVFGLYTPAGINDVGDGSVIVPNGTAALPQFQSIASWSNYTVPNQVFNFNNSMDTAFAPLGCQAGKTANQMCTFNWFNYTGSPVYSIGTDFAAYNATGAWKIRSNVTNLDQFVVYSGGTRTILPAGGSWQVFNHTAGTGVAQINESNGALYANGDMTDGIYAALTGTTGSVGGSSLGAGLCAAGTASIASTTTGMVATTSPATYPGDAFTWRAYVSAAGTVTVKVCNGTAAAATPTASAYNVRVVQ
ncbi:MAG TPA: hypothetical protein VIY53_01820 [Acidobacteriaceae bacterium]